MKKAMLLSVLILSFTLGGCASKAQYYYSKGNHADMIKEFNRKEGLQKLNSIDLFYLCPSFLAMRQYQKSLDCANELEGRDSAVNAMGQYFTTSMFKSSAYLIKLQTYLDTGEFTKAVDYGEKAYTILAQQSGLALFSGMDHVGINIIGDLGIVFALSGKRERAGEMINKLEQYPLSVLRAHVLDPYRQLKIIQIAFALKNYDKVIILCNRNKEIFDGKWWGELPGHRLAYSKLTMDFIRAKSNYESGNLEIAESLYSLLLKTPRVNESSDIYCYSLTDLGLIRLKQARYEEGIDLLSRAVDVLELQRSSITSESAKIGFVGDKQTIYHHLILALYENKQFEKSFEYVERAKARALVDLLAAKKDFVVKGGNEKEIAEVLAKYDSAEAASIIQDVSIDKNMARSIQIKARDDLNTKAPELASLITVTSEPIAKIQSNIPVEEALIEYYYSEGDIYAFILSDGKLQTVRLDGKGMVADVQDFRKLVEVPSSNLFLNVSSKLYKRLFEPMESLLNKHSIIVVPHGVLHYLPLNALYDGKGYLIDRYSIRVMPSSSAIKYLSARKAMKPSGGILIFGNPDLGDPKFNLEYAQKEAIAIANINPKSSRVFLGKEATEGALRKYGNSYSYIHFATHGQFNPEAPLKSAILLAPDSRYNGILTADKLYSLHLDADLVTSSACETGLSRIANGDDLVGLNRGFLYAGCSSIVASLWKVDDLATSYLMTRFYKEIDRTDKREALRTAQLETKKKYPHPYYWASFQLTGNAK